MQLTNNAVQKDGKDYERFEEGNIISVHTLFEYIAQSHFNTSNKTKAVLLQEFFDRVRAIIEDTMRSVKGKIVQQKYTFELLGYDFIIDELMNVVLIEVNTNPCLEESNTLLRKMIPRMLDDLLNITLDPIFTKGGDDTTCNVRYRSKFPLPPEVFQLQKRDHGSKQSEHSGETGETADTMKNENKDCGQDELTI